MNGYSIFSDTLADMTWPAVEAAGKRNAPLLVPVAVIEQHGPHLPLAVDTYGAYLLCRLAKQRLAEAGVEAVIAPPYFWGLNTSTAMFPGSFTVRPETMTTVLTEILENCARWGFHRQFIVNHHGDSDHNRAIVQAVHRLRDSGIEATYLLWGFLASFVKPDQPYGDPPLTGDALLRVPDSDATRSAEQRLTRARGLDVHAGEGETSLIMRYFPDTLNPAADLGALPPVPDTLRQFVEAERRGGWRELSPQGYIGDPAQATADNGELYEYQAADIAAAIEQFLRARSGESGR